MIRRLGWVALLLAVLSCAGSRSSRPVLLIGWDGATWEILDPLLAQGRLPTLARLLARGTGGVLVSTPSCVSPPAWTSLFSGKNPGKTGIFHFGSRLDDFPHLGDLSSADVRTARLWDIMSRHGRRCAIVNLPLTYPASPLNGVAIADEFAPCILAPHRLIEVTTWDTLPAPGRPGRARLLLHETQVDLLVDVYQPTPWMTLRHASSGEVLAGPRQEHLAWSPWFPIVVAGEEGEAKVRLQNLSATRVELWLSPVYRTIERYPAPLTYPVAWAETLKATHGRFLPFVRWHWQPAHEHVGWLGALCRDVQRRESWDLFSCVFLAPDHMQHLYGDGEETAVVLEELDRVTGDLIRHAPKGALVVLVSDHGFRPYSRRVDVNRWLMDLGLARCGADGTVVPESSLAWSTMWAVYLNERLADAPGRERVAARLLEEAPGVVDPQRGCPIGLSLTRREDAYWGPYLREAPHFLVTTQAPGYVAEFWDSKSAAAGRTLCRDTGLHDTWDHAPEGVIVVAGPGIRRSRGRIRLSIYDVVPTVLAWARLPVARDMDGRVARKVFRRPPSVTWCETYEAPPARASVPGGGGLEDRLRALGYIHEAPHQGGPDGTSHP